jgi:CubicO group peptidase (beta-lactamase class C family)
MLTIFHQFNFFSQIIQNILMLMVPLTIILAGCSPKEQHVEEEVYYSFFADSLIIDLDQININKKAEKIDQRFTELSKNLWFNGAVLYSEKGRLVFKKAYGYSDLRRKTDSLTTHSAFQLASVSKMFTAMAILILKEKGELQLDDSIQRFIPEFPYHGITIRQMLVHRSGLSRYMSLAHAQWKDKSIPLTNEDVIRLYAEYQPDPYFTADNGFHYCNTNYALLASVVERISGISFDRFVQKHIFEPLGMDDSFVYNMNGDSTVPSYIDLGVPGHRYRRWRWTKERNDYLNGVMGDKNVYSSVDDLFKWDQALYQNKLVSDSTMQEAFTPGSPKYWKRKDNYAFGWRIKESEDSTAFHFGWWKGFRTFYIRDMKQEKTLVVLTNKDKGPGSRMLWDIIRDDQYELGFICPFKQDSLHQ